MFRWPRIFTSNSAAEDIESQIDDVPVDSVAVAIPSQMSSSNNILNSNLSGSFRDSDDELMERNIYEPIPSTAEPNQLHQSIADMSPSASTSTNPQLVRPSGVAAIPNTQFCPTTPLSSRSNRRGNDGNDDFVV